MAAVGVTIPLCIVICNPSGNVEEGSWGVRLMVQLQLLQITPSCSCFAQRKQLLKLHYCSIDYSEYCGNVYKNIFINIYYTSKVKLAHCSHDAVPRVVLIIVSCLIPG